jgi:alanine-glyoxylate transaminase/serine-glyoxylate transaminase/serine-pyruvate transaminase
MAEPDGRDRPLLMIPGPVEVSPAVLAAFSVPPPGHTAPGLIESFGTALERMRAVWRAPAGSRPLVLAGGGTTAMDSAAANLVEPGERAVVVGTGYFSDRMAEMLRRFGAEVEMVGAEPGEVPALEAVAAALDGAAGRRPPKALFATHVDTSTGVRIDPEPLARLATGAGALSVFDGVCATAGERFEMEAWGADLYLTGSQKALGLPAGLALMVISERAVEARARRRAGPPPMVLDWDQWLPIMRAYEERRPSYFSTPATNLVLALEAGLGEILDDGVERRVERHRLAAEALAAAWRALGLDPVPARPELAAHTLSALRLPEGVDGGLVGRIAERGVMVAGGLHPALAGRYFRVGHMGYTVTRPDWLRHTVRAVAEALTASGHPADREAALAAFEATWAEPAR